MDVRGKLVELLRDVQYLGGLEEKIADRLIANGVTVHEWIQVRHGRWLSWDELHGGDTIAKNVLGVFCSECLQQSDSKTHFCHNCGAKMDGGVENG